MPKDSVPLIVRLVALPAALALALAFGPAWANPDDFPDRPDMAACVPATPQCVMGNMAQLIGYEEAMLQWVMTADRAGIAKVRHCPEFAWIQAHLSVQASLMSSLMSDENVPETKHLEELQVFMIMNEAMARKYLEHCSDG